MKADLHIHSWYSDGTHSPAELLQLASEHQLTDVAVVDHDTFAGQDELVELFADAPINYIEGVEISAYDFKRQRKVHVLGYGIKNRRAVETLCEPLLARRSNNTLWQLRQVQRAGFPVTESEIRTVAKHSTGLYKQHIMTVLIQKGYAQRQYDSLYQRLFKNGGVAQKDIEYVDVFDAIAAIKQGGGMAVIAHPGQLDSYDLIEEAVSYGIDGIEKYHPDHDANDHQRVQELLDRYRLVGFGGSDFHGANGPDYLGKCVIERTQEFPDLVYLS